jgi:signal transduction histidine kinase
MAWLQYLRWKLFVSHLLILLIGVSVLLFTAHFLAVNGITEDHPLAIHVTEGFTSEVVASTATTSTIREDFLAVVDQGILIAGFAAMVVAIIVSLHVSRLIVQPLQELSHMSEELARGLYRGRSNILSNDELGILSRNMNKLAEVLDTTEQRRMALLADVAHELRTPLMAIKGYTDGMLDGVIASDSHNLALIRHEAERMRRLVNDLSELSRAEAGLLPLTLQPVELPALIAYVTQQFELQCEEEALALQVEVPASIPTVIADPQRIEQVLINLLVNAVRYTPAGGTITIRACPIASGVQIAIQDTGIGIAEEHLSAIFERFYRIDRSRNRASGGAGVGLTIAKHLMHAQHGEIWAESPGSGQGATFY